MFWYEKYEKYVVLSVRQRVTEYVCANPNKVIFGPCSYFCFVFLKLDRWPKGRILLT
jgi:hypothetical protein